MSKRKRKKIPTDLVTANITHLNHEGRGVAHINGKTTFIFNALAHETVEFKYTQLHRQYDEGVATHILTASPDRVTPPCPHFGVCGGCSLQHMHHEAQRKHKEAILLEHFQHQAQCKPHTLLPPLYANTLGYRRRARLSVRFVPKKEAVLVGFRERGTSYVAQITTCAVLHPSVGLKIKALSDLFMQCEMKAHIAQIEIAVGDQATAIVIRHLAELPANDINRLIAFAKDNTLQLYFQPKGPDSIHPVYPANPDPLFYAIPKYDLKLFFKPSQFTQINHDINLQMIDRAITLLDLQKTDRVLDLFCGIGNFSLPIATQCHHVVGVEGSSAAIEQAKINASENKLPNTDFFTQDLSIDFSHAAWANQPYDKLLLDPARTGAIELLPYLAVWKPKRIVYISCNPITLARDTKIILENGYRLEQAGIMDMFPHTDHIEAIALFIRN